MKIIWFMIMTVELWKYMRKDYYKDVTLSVISFVLVTIINRRH